MSSLNPSRLWKQVGLGEDTSLELKAVEFSGARVSSPRRDSLADEIAAFGNGNGGRLVLGVTDDRHPQSLDPSMLDALISFVGEICKDSIKPPLYFSAFRVAAGSVGGGALVVEIPESPTVHRSPGGYFRRWGDSKRQMEMDEVHQLLHRRGLSDAISTDTQVVQGTGINSLQPKLWRGYVSSRVRDSAEVALTKLKFVKADLHGHLRATVGGGAFYWHRRIRASGCQTLGFKPYVIKGADRTPHSKSIPVISPALLTGRFARPYASWWPTSV